MYSKRVDTLVTDFLARGLVDQVKEACAKEASLLEGASRYVWSVLFAARMVHHELYLADNTQHRRQPSSAGRRC
jgi:hypothetical protein